jgi:hypothetical protein
MEMRRQGFDYCAMEGPQNIRQEFLLGYARSALGARPAGQEVPFPSLVHHGFALRRFAGRALVQDLLCGDFD